MARKTQARRKRKNFDPIGVAAGLSAVQSARDLGWLDTSSRPIHKKKHHRNPDVEVSRGHIDFVDFGSIERYQRGGYIYRAFTATPIFSDGYRMGAVESFAPEVMPANRMNPRRNPEAEADAVYEEFHGEPPAETLAIRETERVHEHLAGLGDLVCIVVKLSGGTHAGEKKQLNAPDPATAADVDVVRVSCNEAKNQLYLVGGDQAVNVKALGFRDSFDINHDGETFEATELKDLMVLGEIHRLTYRTQKEFDKFEDIDYFHKVGEDTRVRPFLLYDTMNDRMKIAGGEYTIHARGIVN